MSVELNKRIKTSLLLLIFLILSLFVSTYFFLIIILCVSFYAYYEFVHLLKKAFKTKKINKIYWYPTNILVIFFFLIFFNSSSLFLYIKTDPFYFFYILSICFFSDMGGYFVGKNFGGKKLTKLSPNKTISGSLGSFFFSIIPLFLLSTFSINEFFLSYKYIIFSLLVCLISQLGDIFISYVKRMARVKDTGSLLPGHGGILDRIDGIIFAIPFSCFYLVGSPNISFIINNLSIF